MSDSSSVAVSSDQVTEVPLGGVATGGGDAGSDLDLVLLGAGSALVAGTTLGVVVVHRRQQAVGR
ncbi:hypothetical protein [Saccharopolyspora thermophila]|uniref:hypothetical protein n=1 Tax=Saccharopolyspora thermophila TaxID=89367 RepID=UPI001E35240E|nr:hypothetical protein [Saccharopolyspora subtropica]